MCSCLATPHSTVLSILRRRTLWFQALHFPGLHTWYLHRSTPTCLCAKKSCEENLEEGGRLRHFLLKHRCHNLRIRPFHHCITWSRRQDFFIWWPGGTYFAVDIFLYDISVLRYQYQTFSNEKSSVNISVLLMARMWLAIFREYEREKQLMAISTRHSFFVRTSLVSGNVRITIIQYFLRSLLGMTHTIFFSTFQYLYHGIFYLFICYSKSKSS